MKVHLVAYTTVHRDIDEETPFRWPDDATSDGEVLTEFAGRACYQSWSRPNANTATNKGYLSNIINKVHWSVFEHSTATFYLEGVSRSLTHELVRHRHLSFSQLSQRYVEMAKTIEPVIPPIFKDEEQVLKLIGTAWQQVIVPLYIDLVKIAEAKGATHKQAREAARCILPNMTPTSIVVTGNHRAWREVIMKRATIHADAEIREVAVEIFRQLAILEPHLYQDGHIVSDDNGEVVAWRI